MSGARWIIVAVLGLGGLACEKKESAPPPAPAAEAEPPPVQIEVTADEQAAFAKTATAEITPENADTAAAALLAEIEADLAAD